MVKRVFVLLLVVCLKRGFSNRPRAVVLFSSDHTLKVTVKLCKLESERGGIGERFVSCAPAFLAAWPLATFIVRVLRNLGEQRDFSKSALANTLGCWHRIDVREEK